MLHKFSLHLFDGEGGGDGAGATAGTTAEAGVEGVIDSGVEGEVDTSNVETDETAQRKTDYQNFRSEYKSEIEQEIKNIVGKRLAGKDKLQAQVNEMSPILDLMRNIYGVDDNTALLDKLQSDDELIADKAAEMGMSTQAYRQFMEMKSKADAAEQQRQQSERDEYLQKLYNEEAEVKAAYPDFNPELEMKNPEYVSMLKSGVPMMHAYQVLHMEELMTGALATAQRRGAEIAQQNAAKRASRPREPGGNNSMPAHASVDIANMTKAEAEALEKRAMRGERITLK